MVLQSNLAGGADSELSRLVAHMSYACEAQCRIARRQLSVFLNFNALGGSPERQRTVGESLDKCVWVTRCLESDCVENMCIGSCRACSPFPVAAEVGSHNTLGHFRSQCVSSRHDTKLSSTCSEGDVGMQNSCVWQRGWRRRRFRCREGRRVRCRVGGRVGRRIRSGVRCRIRSGVRCRVTGGVTGGVTRRITAGIIRRGTGTRLGIACCLLFPCTLTRGCVPSAFSGVNQFACSGGGATTAGLCAG